MSIALTTPTGNIGRHVVRELMNAGKSIRVITRNPDRLDADVRAYATVIQGSIDDAALLIRSLDGAEAFFWCVPQSNTQEDVLEYYLQFARVAATAIGQTETPRVVVVSSGGKGLAKNAGPISALHAMEELLNETGAAIKHLRSGNFMENFLSQIGSIAKQGIFFYPVPADFPMPMVAACDIGTVAAQWLMNRDWSGQSGIGVQGAEELSLSQAAEIFGAAIDRPVRFQPVSSEAFYKSLLNTGSSPAFAQSLVEMFTAVAEGLYQAELRTPETTTATTLKHWTETVMCPLIER